MALNTNSKGQIKQMTNFILQEAHEKANEIMIKTEHDVSNITTQGAKYPQHNDKR